MLMAIQQIKFILNGKFTPTYNHLSTNWRLVDVSNISGYWHNQLCDCAWLWGMSDAYSYDVSCCDADLNDLSLPGIKILTIIVYWPLILFLQSEDEDRYQQFTSCS